MNYDIIGDVHGFYVTLLALLGKLGYKLRIDDSKPVPTITVHRTPKNRRLVFVGDLINRGPDSVLVLNLVMQLVEQGAAVVVKGNHEARYLDLLNGKKKHYQPALRATDRAVRACGTKFRQRVHEFIKALPAKFETDEFIVVHAAYADGLNGEGAERFFVHGQSGRTRAGQKPRWVRDYRGKKTVICGHLPQRRVMFFQSASGAMVVNVDTGRSTKLSAVRAGTRKVVSADKSNKSLEPRKRRKAADRGTLSRNMKKRGACKDAGNKSRRGKEAK